MDKVDWDRQASVMWISVPEIAVANAAYIRGPGPRLFSSMTKAVRFVMEELSERDRGTVRVECGSKHFGAAEIARLYARIKYPVQRRDTGALHVRHRHARSPPPGSIQPAPHFTQEMVSLTG